ncbi:hypothetical protein H5410_015284 [Solanum commersonii]|uniref:Uncharacterized protein n=1 Tax=Solanum commersonii TaxID=4109 RepID=A0A9J5ZTZ0_SOLCO|nr:hypothetical protein H5410_015284 [Solanum commersonii]
MGQGWGRMRWEFEEEETSRGGGVLRKGWRGLKKKKNEVDKMSQGASFVATTQSFISDASSFNIKCSSCRCKGYEQQHEYFISRVKELTNIFKKTTYNIDVHTSKKISQPLKLKEKINEYCSSIFLNRKRQGERKRKKRKRKRKRRKSSVVM